MMQDTPNTARKTTGAYLADGVCWICNTLTIDVKICCDI